MNLLQQLENAPKNLVLYVLGLIGAVVDDYSLVTLLIFCVLLGFVLDSILIPATAFFGLYFLLRLVNNLAEGIGLHAQATHQSGQMQAQSTMQIAAALAQFHPPVQQSGPHDAPGVGLRGE
jgi:type IV secretory pathway VirB6-like protein